jgi:preprotein translocase subunit SecB
VAQNTAKPLFALEKIYVKDLSFEAPNAPFVFMEKEPPELNVELSIQHRELNPSEKLFEVVLAVTATAKRTDKNYFLAEVQQAGVFRVQGIEGEVLAKTLEISCAHVLLPFAREAVNDIVTKGGFPPLLLNPMNFEALYEQKHAALKKQALN